MLLYIVASIFHQMLNINLTLSIILTIIVSTFFTAAEGNQSIQFKSRSCCLHNQPFFSGKSRLLWTDVIWSILIFVGLVAIFIIALVETGSYRDLMEKARQNSITGNSITSFPPQTLTTVYFGQLLIWTCIYSGFHSAGKEDLSSK